MLNDGHALRVGRDWIAKVIGKFNISGLVLTARRCRCSWRLGHASRSFGPTRTGLHLADAQGSAAARDAARSVVRAVSCDGPVRYFPEV